MRANPGRPAAPPTGHLLGRDHDQHVLAGHLVRACPDVDLIVTSRRLLDLAAAQLRSLSPYELLDQLTTTGYGLLRRTAADRPPHQRTPTASIERSIGLLTVPRTCCCSAWPACPAPSPWPTPKRRSPTCRAGRARRCCRTWWTTRWCSTRGTPSGCC
ncbi:hypothetical protein ACIBO5_41905 [Nonomuraea angiospora]|uniref:hypothetical protein n=1 Tax=Nonomuraea angiospora TaxID=46172 RepID=UPI0037883721